MRSKKQYKVGWVISLFLLAGCNKLVNVSLPLTSLSGPAVYQSDATAIATMTGVFTQLSGNYFTDPNFRAIPLFTALSSDELSMLQDGGNFKEPLTFYKNDLAVTTNDGGIWKNLYSNIYRVNDVIEGVTKSQTLTPGIKQQLLGEAKFMRAYFYFYLVNLYGDVPVVTATEYTANALLPRNPATDAWKLVTDDLKEAQSLLSEDYLDGRLTGTTVERVRPTRWAATALLARVYLYQKDWENAEIQATAVLSKPAIYKLDSLNGAFLRNNQEAIWQFQPIDVNANSREAGALILTAGAPNSAYQPFFLNTQLLNAFEPGDKRRTSWVDSITTGGVTYRYAFKYKVYKVPSPTTEYSTLLRLSEQYLIRAEARVQLNDLSGAADDLDAVRTRAGLGNTSASTAAGLLAAIMHERQTELFLEGHRWLDLKRTGMVDAVMGVVTPLKAGQQWKSYQQLYNLPLSDVLANPKLKQNPEY